MAVLAIAAGGALLGNAIGIGANVGWIIGAVVGQLLFPTKDETQTQFNEGPRLGDLSVTSSAYGSPRAIGYGTVRMGGNVIWSNGIRETKHVEYIYPPSSGKGGLFGGGNDTPAAENTTYTYSASWAVAFGEGVAVDVLRIWGDGKLLLDKTGGNVQVLKEGFKYRFYPGNETQGRDSLMSADKGTTNTPAYRGTVYLLFDDVQLKDFGNRLPNITAEIAFQGTRARPQTIEVYSDNIQDSVPDGESITFDWDRGYYYSYCNTPSGLMRLNMNTQTTDLFIDAAGSLDSGTFSSGGSNMLSCMPNGDIVCQVADPIGNTMPIVVLDSDSYKEIGRFGSAGAGLVPTKTSVVSSLQCLSQWLFGAGTDACVIMITSTASPNVPWHTQFLKVQNGTFEYLWDSWTFSDQDPRDLTLGDDDLAACAGSVTDQFSYFYTAALAAAATENLQVTRWSISGNAGYSLVDGNDTSEGFAITVREFTPDEFWADWLVTDDWDGCRLIWDSANAQLIIFGSIDGDSEWAVIAYDPFTDTINWTSDEKYINSPQPDAGHESKLVDDTFGWCYTERAFWINTVTGQAIENDVEDFAEGSAFQSNGAWDSSTQTWQGVKNDSFPSEIGDGQGPYIRSFFGRYTGGADTVGAVVDDVCSRVGLTSTDVTDLNSLSLPGYFIGRQASGRGSIEPLAQFYLFDGFESDFSLEFKQRGSTGSIRTIMEDQLAVVEDKTNDLIKESRVQEVELPEQFSITYMDKDNDYVQNTQTMKRVQNPTPAMFSRNKVGLSLNAALSNTAAKQQVEKALYASWIERSTFELKFPWEQIDLDPGDVITVTLDDGTTFEMRIIKIDVNENFIMQVSAIGQRPGLFVSNAAATDITGVEDQFIKTSSFVRSWVMDIPLLRDSDENIPRLTSAHYLWQAGFADGQFEGGRIYFSSDNDIYLRAATMINETPYGNILGTIPDPPFDNPFAPDESTQLNVKVTVGEDMLESVTYTEMLSGRNAAIIIKADGGYEVIQYQNVTAEADGTYTLDFLLRGRRGTDTMAFTHGSNEQILFVDLFNVTGEVTGLVAADLNDQPTYWRGLGRGQIFQQAHQQQFTTEMRGLMPYAPVNVTADYDATDIDIAWERRNRTGGALQNGSGDVPISEDSEEYEIDIYEDSTFTTIVSSTSGSQTGLTSPAATYTAADIASDFPGGIGVYLYCRIYQISGQVGRGFTYDHAVEIDAL